MSVVVAVALLAGGRVLMQQRPVGKQHGGLWEFPGGKVEKGEGPRAAAVRELAEELGVAIAPGDLAEVGFAAHEPGEGGRPLVILLYACQRWQGEPQALEAAAFGWFAPGAVGDLAMPPLDYPLARALEAWVAGGKER